MLYKIHLTHGDVYMILIMIFDQLLFVDGMVKQLCPRSVNVNPLNGALTNFPRNTRYTAVEVNELWLQGASKYDKQSQKWAPLLNE